MEKDQYIQVAIPVTLVMHLTVPAEENPADTLKEVRGLFAQRADGSYPQVRYAGQVMSVQPLEGFVRVLTEPETEEDEDE